jgi:hypothetical protein
VDERTRQESKWERCNDQLLASRNKFRERGLFFVVHVFLVNGVRVNGRSARFGVTSYAVRNMTYETHSSPLRVKA